MSTAPFVGYPAQIWGACWQALSWLSGRFAAAPSDNPVTALESPVNVVFDTLWNGLTALSAWQTGTTLSIEAQNFIQLQSLPLGLDPVTQGFVQARIIACSAAASGISALVPPVQLLNVATRLAAGRPVIADPGLLEWCMNFAGEAAPVASLLPDAAWTAAAAWLTTVNAVAVLQGSTALPVYDVAARQYRCASAIATILTQTQSGGFFNANVISLLIPMTDDLGNVVTDDLGNTIYVSSGTEGTGTWSTVVSLPTLLLDAATLGTVPASLSAQQVSVIRYVLIAQLLQLAKLLLSFRSKNVIRPGTGYLRNTESLMDFAARTTGDFANWANIAALNGIVPPYPGPTNPALALQGRQLFTAGIPVGTSTQATYLLNVLGSDYDFGAINGTQPPWLGDISLITGYLNFARAIGRRIQTPLGGLVYHRGYGCSIPAEIGAIQSVDEAARLVEYGRSAIRGDPRTGAILSATASVSPGFAAHFQAAISPIGPGASSVAISEVIGARPSGG